jgi:putative endonuclease
VDTNWRHGLLDAPPEAGHDGRGVIARSPGDPVFQRRVMEARSFYVYILASRIGGTLYIGVTNDLIRRVGEHRLKLAEGFTKKYEIARLVYFEQFDDIENAIKREKRLKKWNRAWKIRLIEEKNPNWDDLYPGIAGA